MAEEHDAAPTYAELTRRRELARRLITTEIQVHVITGEQLDTEEMRRKLVETGEPFGESPDPGARDRARRQFDDALEELGPVDLARALVDTAAGFCVWIAANGWRDRLDAREVWQQYAERAFEIEHDRDREIFIPLAPDEYVQHLRRQGEHEEADKVEQWLEEHGDELDEEE